MNWWTFSQQTGITNEHQKREEEKKIQQTDNFFLTDINLAKCDKCESPITWFINGTYSLSFSLYLFFSRSLAAIQFQTELAPMNSKYAYRFGTFSDSFAKRCWCSSCIYHFLFVHRMQPWWRSLLAFVRWDIKLNAKIAFKLDPHLNLNIQYILF